MVSEYCLWNNKNAARYSKASVNTISVNTIFEITQFWLLSQIFQFCMISPQKPLNKDNNLSALLSLRGAEAELLIKTLMMNWGYGWKATIK